MANVLAASHALFGPAVNPESPTPREAEPAAVEDAIDLPAPAPATAQVITESLPVLVARQTAGTRHEGLPATRVEPVTRARASLGVPRRTSLVVAAIAIAFVSFFGAIAIGGRLGAASAQPGDRSEVGLASPAPIGARSDSAPTPDPTPIPTYSAAIRPGPITFGTKLSGLTVADPTTRIKIGPRVMWVAQMSQPSIESAVEMSLTVLVSGKQIVIHRESTPIGLNGLLTANPGVNSRDLGLGKFVVRYTSQGIVLAEGSFTVVK